MNERRMSTCSNSNASISSSVTSLDTVVNVTQPPVIKEQQTQRSRSLPSSTSTPTSNSNSSAGKTASSNSSTGSSYSSESPLSTTSHSSSTSYSSSSSYDTYSSSFSSSSPRSSSHSSPSPKISSKMPNKVVSIRKKRPLNAYESAGEEEILATEPPSKVERNEEVKREKKNTCECCCYCQSWSYASPELVVLVACGSFNPITTMHLRMMGEWMLLICDINR